MKFRNGYFRHREIMLLKSIFLGIYLTNSRSNMLPYWEALICQIGKRNNAKLGSLYWIYLQNCLIQRSFSYNSNHNT